MTDSGGEENAEIVSLFDNDLKHQENYFEDKLDKTDIYNNKDDEEIFIATSPSFSCSKESMAEFYDAHDDNLKKDITSTIVHSCDDEQLKCDTAFPSDISNDSQPVEYSDSTDTTYHHNVGNIEGQSFLITSDFTHLNNIGIEISKGYFYVLSPMASNNTLLRAPIDENFSQMEESTLLKETRLNQTTKSIAPRDANTDPVESNICDGDTSAAHDLTTFQTSDSIIVTQSENSDESSRNHDFDHLSTDYASVSFINGIGDSPAKEQQLVTWHKVSSTETSDKPSDLQQSLLMKYDHDTKMEIPVVDGQPYLQVALVNDMDTTTTSDFVSTDQILGVSIPELFICKWESCGVHTLTTQDLVIHVNSTHVELDSKQQYTCYWKGCVRLGKPFNARYKLAVHLRTHTGEKPHTCPNKGCEASFSRPENMKIHMRIHTGEKPYTCQYEGCDKSFANSSDRVKHLRTHHEKQPFRCNVIGCGKSYTDPSTLRKHKKRHTNGTLPVPKVTMK